jgi:hypothetical protein
MDNVVARGNINQNCSTTAVTTSSSFKTNAGLLAGLFFYFDDKYLHHIKSSNKHIMLEPLRVVGAYEMFTSYLIAL